MNNKELQTELSRRLSLSQKEVAGLMKLFVDEYTERFSEGEDELPFLGLGTLEVRQKEQRAGWYLGLLTAGALLLIYGWVYNIRMAGANLAVDIAAYVVILALGFAVALWIPVTKRWRSPLLMLTGVLAVLVVVFTFYTPDTLLFADLELADALYTLPC